MCILSIHLQKLLVIMSWVFCPCQWWFQKKLDGVSSIQFFWIFVIVLNFAKPLSQDCLAEATPTS